MQNDYTVIPTLQIRPNYMLVYNVLEGIRHKPPDPWHGQLYAFKKSPAYQGLMTVGSRKNLKRAIENLMAIARDKEATNHKLNRNYKWKVNFVTLTLPCAQGKHTDKDVKSKCLDNWLKSAKRRFSLKSYVWRAERQKNGNVHFHIICDTWIDHTNLRLSWNHQLEHLGFVSEFEKKHGHRNPNSTDVHSVKKVKDLAAYMVKYMCKPENLSSRFIAQPPWRSPEKKVTPNKKSPKFTRLLTLDECKINGRLWDCSTNLKSKEKCDFIIDTETQKLIEDAINVHNCRYKITDVCSMIFTTPKQFEAVVTGRYRTAWESHLDKMRVVI